MAQEGSNNIESSKLSILAPALLLLASAALCNFGFSHTTVDRMRRRYLNSCALTNEPERQGVSHQAMHLFHDRVDFIDDAQNGLLVKPEIHALQHWLTAKWHLSPLFGISDTDSISGMNGSLMQDPRYLAVPEKDRNEFPFDLAGLPEGHILKTVLLNINWLCQLDALYLNRHGQIRHYTDGVDVPIENVRLVPQRIGSKKKAEQVVQILKLPDIPIRQRIEEVDLVLRGMSSIEKEWVLNNYVYKYKDREMNKKPNIRPLVALYRNKLGLDSHPRIASASLGSVSVV